MSGFLCWKIRDSLSKRAFYMLLSSSGLAYPPGGAGRGHPAAGSGSAGQGSPRDAAGGSGKRGGAGPCSRAARASSAPFLRGVRWVSCRFLPLRCPGGSHCVCPPTPSSKSGARPASPTPHRVCLFLRAPLAPSLAGQPRLAPQTGHGPPRSHLNGSRRRRRPRRLHSRRSLELGHLR